MIAKYKHSCKKIALRMGAPIPIDFIACPFCNFPISRGKGYTLTYELCGVCKYELKLKQERLIQLFITCGKFGMVYAVEEEIYYKSAAFGPIKLYQDTSFDLQSCLNTMFLLDSIKNISNKSI